MSSVIRLVCPNLKCRKVLSVPKTARGRTVRCRACGMRVNVPGKKTPNLPPMLDLESQTDLAQTEETTTTETK